MDYQSSLETIQPLKNNMMPSKIDFNTISEPAHIKNNFNTINHSKKNNQQNLRYQGTNKQVSVSGENTSSKRSGTGGTSGAALAAGILQRNNQNVYTAGKGLGMEVDNGSKRASLGNKQI